MLHFSRVLEIVQFFDAQTNVDAKVEATAEAEAEADAEDGAGVG